MVVFLVFKKLGGVVWGGLPGGDGHAKARPYMRMRGADAVVLVVFLVFHFVRFVRVRGSWGWRRINFLWGLCFLTWIRGDG